MSLAKWRSTAWWKGTVIVVRILGATLAVAGFLVMVAATVDAWKSGAEWILIPLGLLYLIVERLEGVPGAVWAFIVGAYLFVRVGDTIAGAIHRQTDAMRELLERLDDRR